MVDWLLMMHVQGSSPAVRTSGAGQADQRLPAKPKPPGRQVQQPLSPQIVPQLPYATGPFPGVHKPSLGSAYGQPAHKPEPSAATPAFDVGILAQHAFGKTRGCAQAPTVYASRY